MRLEQLQYLLEISKCHSLTIAAERLYITQPALSRAIILLEKELDVSLLYRSSTGVHLTPAAKKILPYIKNIILQTEHIRETAESYHKTTRIFEEVSFSIITSAAIVDTYLSFILQIYKENYPLTDINISLASTQALLSMTNQEHDKLLLVTQTTNSYPEILQSSSLHGDLLLTENYSAVVRRDSDIAKKKYISLKDALKRKLIFGNNGIDLPVFFEKELEENPSLDILLMSNNIDIVKKMLLAYDALFISNNTLISNSDFTSEFKIIPLKNKKIPCQTNLYAFYPENHPQKEYIQDFLDKFKIINNYCHR